MVPSMQGSIDGVCSTSLFRWVGGVWSVLPASSVVLGTVTRSTLAGVNATVQRPTSPSGPSSCELHVLAVISLPAIMVTNCQVLFLDCRITRNRETIVQIANQQSSYSSWCHSNRCISNSKCERLRSNPGWRWKKEIWKNWGVLDCTHCRGCIGTPKWGSLWACSEAPWKTSWQMGGALPECLAVQVTGWCLKT